MSFQESRLLQEQYERAKEERDKKNAELIRERKQTESLQRKHEELRERKESVEKDTRQMVRRSTSFQAVSKYAENEI